jgi:predicted DNA-binding protein
MKESKVLSIRISSEIHEDFKSLCTRNEKSAKDILVECITLLLDADKIELKTKPYYDEYD